MKRSRWISPERGKLKTKLLCVYFLLLVLPLAYLLSLTGRLEMVWWAFPIAEVLAGLLAAVFLRRAYLRVIKSMRAQDYQF